MNELEGMRAQYAEHYDITQKGGATIFTHKNGSLAIKVTVVNGKNVVQFIHGDASSPKRES